MNIHTDGRDYVEWIAHISEGEEVFQVLNEAGDDWDEAATYALRDAWLAEHGA